MIPGAEYFDRMYADSDDPWDFAGSPYERRKYELTVASLPRREYARAYEPGCSVGELTALLAPRCGRLLSEDRAERAVELARRTVTRAGVSDRVDLRVGDLRTSLDELEPGSLDLVVLSEILYYFPVAEAAELAVRAAGLLAPGGTLVLVSWRGHSPHHACTGDEVHAAAVPRLVASDPGPALRRQTSLVDEGFALDVFVWDGAAGGSE